MFGHLSLTKTVKWKCRELGGRFLVNCSSISSNCLDLWKGQLEYCGLSLVWSYFMKFSEVSPFILDILSVIEAFKFKA